MKLLKGLLLGFACVSIGSMSFASTGPAAKKVNFCELYQHPESYAGKLVQVHGIIYGIKHMRIEDASYPGTRCGSYMMIAFLIPKGRSGPHAPVRDAAFDSLEAGIKSGKRVIADIQGFFEFLPKHTGPRTAPAAQLVLFKASNVVVLPVPRK